MLFCAIFVVLLLAQALNTKIKYTYAKNATEDLGLDKMRVKIGKYPSRLVSNVHTNHMNKKYGFSWPKRSAWTNTDKILEKIEDALLTIYQPFNRLIFDRRKQTVKVKIDPWDTWSMDSTLGHIVLPMLKQLRKTKHGGPFVDNEDVPEYLQATPEDIAILNQTGTTDKNFFARWDWVMGEMIFAFESLNNDWEEQFYSGEIDFHSVPVDAQGNEVADDEAEFFKLDRGPDDTFEVDLDGMKKYQQRIDNGFMLFGKYYRALWD